MQKQVFSEDIECSEIRYERQIASDGLDSPIVYAVKIEEIREDQIYIGRIWDSGAGLLEWRYHYNSGELEKGELPTRDGRIHHYSFEDEIDGIPLKVPEIENPVLRDMIRKDDVKSLLAAQPHLNHIESITL